MNVTKIVGSIYKIIKEIYFHFSIEFKVKIYNLHRSSKNLKVLSLNDTVGVSNIKLLFSYGQYI